MKMAGGCSTVHWPMAVSWSAGLGVCPEWATRGKFGDDKCPSWDFSATRYFSTNPRSNHAILTEISGIRMYINRPAVIEGVSLLPIRS
jgi:hypothetical protein